MTAEIKPGTLNLKDEMAQTEHGLRFDVRPGTSIDLKTGRMRPCWQMEISRLSVGPYSGRRKVVLLVRIATEREDETPANLLRTAAQCYEQGDVQVKVP